MATWGEDDSFEGAFTFGSVAVKSNAGVAGGVAGKNAVKSNAGVAGEVFLASEEVLLARMQ